MNNNSSVNSFERLEQLEVYQIAMAIGKTIWDVVITWDAFAKFNFGGQFVSAADSIAHNISEGYGRYFYKENRQFCFYARGSLFETYTQLMKSKERNLIMEAQYNDIKIQLDVLKPKLNAYINSIGKSPSP